MLENLIEEVNERVTGLVEHEVAEREKTEENLIELLEQTCARVERTLASQQNWYNNAT